MPGSPAEVLRALNLALEQVGARWYVFGAQAVVVWGRARLTEDIDIAVAGTPAGSRALLDELVAAGFRLRVEDVDNFVARTWVLPMEHVATEIPVDIVLASSGLESQFLERARAIDLEGVRVPVISPEDLIVSKILAGRPKDLEDVLGVLKAQRGRLNLEAVMDLVGLLEQALDQSDLLPTLRRLMRQARVTPPE